MRLDSLVGRMLWEKGHLAYSPVVRACCFILGVSSGVVGVLPHPGIPLGVLGVLHVSGVPLGVWGCFWGVLGYGLCMPCACAVGLQ